MLNFIWWSESRGKGEEQKIYLLSFCVFLLFYESVLPSSSPLITAGGRFLDSVRCGASVDRRPHYRVTPTTTNRHPQIQKKQINTHNHTLLAHIHVFISPWNKISTTNCFPSSPIYFPPNFLLQFYILTECTFYINRGSKIY